MMNIQDKKILFMLSGIIIILDRVTKVLAELFLKDRNQPVHVIDGFFNLVYSTNQGALFGFGHDLSYPLRLMALTILPLAVIVIIVIILLKARPEEKIVSLGMSLILGGAIGNLIDRFAYGEVIDFLDFYIGRYRWPTFNLGDSFITIGIACVFFELIVKRR